MQTSSYKQATYALPAVANPFVVNSLALRSRSDGDSFWETASLADLRPTQMAVGLRAVDAKRRKIERHGGGRRKLRRFLEKRPIPVVVGPQDELYLIDHHHLCLALWHNEVDEVFVRIVSDLSDMNQRQFQRAMTALGWMHSFDAKGQKICPSKLPPSLDRLRHDPYRDLAWSVRKAGGFEKTDIPFIEFAWANYFRHQIPLHLVRGDFQAAREAGLRLARSRNASMLPGYLRSS